MIFFGQFPLSEVYLIYMIFQGLAQLPYSGIWLVTTFPFSFICDISGNSCDQTQNLYINY